MYILPLTTFTTLYQPNITLVYNMTCSLFQIMDRLSRDLFAALKSKSLDPRTRFNISLDIVEGARYLHNQGLVHRDLKLQNVLVSFY